MTEKKLPEFIPCNCIGDEQEKLVLDGKMSVGLLSGLLMPEEKNQLAIKSTLYSEKQRRYFWKGDLVAQLVGVCSFCSGPVPLVLRKQFFLVGGIFEKKSESLPNDSEFFEVDGEKISIHAQLEQEILLLLPMVIRHQAPCRAQYDDTDRAGVARGPFALLKNVEVS